MQNAKASRNEIPISISIIFIHTYFQKRLKCAKFTQHFKYLTNVQYCIAEVYFV